MILLLMMMMTQQMLTTSSWFWPSQPTTDQAELQDNINRKGSFSDILRIFNSLKPLKYKDDMLHSDIGKDPLDFSFPADDNNSNSKRQVSHSI